MRNLVPEFIYSHYIRRKRSGRFQAAALFVDISGFTGLSDFLMDQGEDGAEVLSSVLDTIFNPLVVYIYKNGGFISSFAGDGFTALFPITKKNAALYSVQAAVNIRDHFLTHKSIETRYGEFDVAVRMGLSFGQVSWRILGYGEALTYYFHGETIDGCVKMQKLAREGCIALDQVLLPELGDYVLTEKKVDHVLVNRTSHVLPAKRIKSTEQHHEILKMFALKDVTALQVRGEFRNVCSVFVSFDRSLPEEQFTSLITTVIDLAAHYKLYFNKVDFGDKGGVMLILAGAPLSFERNVQRVLSFLLNLREQTQGTPLKAHWRAGVSYGTVYAGIIGGQQRCEYTAIGDVVNLSARLMMQAQWGEILVMERVFRSTRHHFEMQFVGNYQFKGLSQPLPTYRLISVKSEHKQLFSGNMVGREKTFENASAILNSFVSGSSRGILYIHGEQGIGKSRLIHSLHQNLNQRDICWFTCLSQEMENSSLYPFIYALHEYFDQSSQKSSDHNRNRFDTLYDNLIKRLVQSSGNDPGDIHGLVSELERCRSILGAHLGLTWPDSVWSKLNARGRYENTLGAIVTLFQAESKTRPVVLELEDIQWLDGDSETLLLTCIRTIKNSPFGVVATGRLNDDGTTPVLSLGDFSPFFVTLDLLDREQLRQLIRERAMADISDDLLDIVFERTRGNPFFTEQMLSYLQEQDRIEYNPTGLRVKDSSDDSIPESIRSILISRLDRLSPEVKHIVQVAAVLGNEFEAVPLLTVLRLLDPEYPVRQFYPRLFLATQAKIWSPIKDIRFVFSQGLLRQTAYTMQLRKHRQKLHGLVAHALEILNPDDPAGYAELARHYGEAGNRKKQMLFLDKAADFAHSMFQNDTADRYYSELMKMVGDHDHERIVALSLDRGKAQINLGQWESARHMLETARELAKNNGFAEQVAQTNIWLGKLFVRTGEYETARSSFNLALEWFLETNNTPGQALCFEQLGNNALKKGDLVEALACFVEQQHTARADKLTETSGRTDSNLGQVFYRQGTMDAARHHFSQALEKARSTATVQSELVTLGWLGLTHLHLWDYEQARQYFVEQLQLSEELGEQRTKSSAFGNLGLICLNQGDFSLASDFFVSQREIADQLGDLFSLFYAFSNQVRLWCERSKYSKALELAWKNLAEAERLGDIICICGALKTMAQVHLEFGKYSAALTCINRLEELSRNVDNWTFLTQALIRQGELFIKMDSRDKARKTLNEGLNLAERSGYKLLQFRAECSLAILEFEQNPDTAVKKLITKLDEATYAGQRAFVNHQLWNLTGEESYRNISEKLYGLLYEKTKRRRYLKPSG